jgi:hypothetical protein
MILLIKSEHVGLQIKQFAVLKMTHNDNKWKTEFEDIFYKDCTTVSGERDGVVG